MKRNTKVRYDVDDRGGDLPSSRCIHGGMGEVSNQPQPAWEELRMKYPFLEMKIEKYLADFTSSDTIMRDVSKIVMLEVDQYLATERAKWQEEIIHKITGVKAYNIPAMEMKLQIIGSLTPPPHEESK